MKKTGARALLALLIAGSVAVQAQFAAPPAGHVPPTVRQLAVEVCDFRLLPTDARDFLPEDAANPLEDAPAPLLDPAELDRLPEEDRLPILLKEQEAKREWQERKQAIDLQRYNEQLDANSRVRDAMLTDEGRAVRQGSGIMEAALGARPDVFALVHSGAGTGDAAPAEYRVEGIVGDLAERNTSQVSGFATVQTRVYSLPVTIKLHETGSGRTVWVYSEELTIRDMAAGRAPMSRQEAVQTLLRQAAKAAADQFATACLPLTRTVPVPADKADATGAEGSSGGI